MPRRQAARSDNGQLSIEKMTHRRVFFASGAAQKSEINLSQVTVNFRTFPTGRQLCEKQAACASGAHRGQSKCSLPSLEKHISLEEVLFETSPKEAGKCVHRASGTCAARCSSRCSSRCLWAGSSGRYEELPLELDASKG